MKLALSTFNPKRRAPDDSKAPALPVMQVRADSRRGAVRISGKPLAAVFKERFFTPIGMNATALDDVQEIVPNRASGYDLERDQPGVTAGASWASAARTRVAPEPRVVASTEPTMTSGKPTIMPAVRCSFSTVTPSAIATAGLT